MYNQLPMQPRFRVKGEKRIYSSIHGAALEIGDLTLNRKYTLHDRNAILRAEKSLKNNLCMVRNTIFHEVEAVSQLIETPLKELITNRVRRGYASLEDFAAALLAAMKKHLWETWDQWRPHIFLHSSGYDTRLISALLRSMNIDRNITYVCFEPEHKIFRKIADHMGWPKDKMFLLPENMEGYVEPLRFEEVGGHCSDANRISLHLWSWFIKEMATKDTQIVLGMYSDELYKNMNLGTARFMTNYLHDVHWEWEGMDVYMPFLSCDWVWTLMKHKMRDWGADLRVRLKHMLISMVDKELADIPLGNIVSKKRFPESAVRSMQKDFSRSWYYRTVLKKGELPNGMVKNAPPIWREYFKAAICEYLINEGCRIK